MKKYYKIEVAVVKMQTATIMNGSTLGVDNTPVGPEGNGFLPAGARGGINRTASDLDLI